MGLHDYLCFDLPLTSSACNHTGEPHRELWGNETPKNNVEWMTSHRDCTCRVEHLKKEPKMIDYQMSKPMIGFGKPHCCHSLNCVQKLKKQE